MAAIAEFAALAGVVGKLGKWGIKGAENATNWFIKKNPIKSVQSVVSKNRLKNTGFVMQRDFKDFLNVANKAGKIGMGVAGETVAGKKGYDYYQDYRNGSENNNATNQRKSVTITNHYNNTFEGSKSGYQDFFNMLEGNQRKQSVAASTLLP